MRSNTYVDRDTSTRCLTTEPNTIKITAAHSNHVRLAVSFELKTFGMVWHHVTMAAQGHVSRRVRHAAGAILLIVRWEPRTAPLLSTDLPAPAAAAHSRYCLVALNTIASETALGGHFKTVHPWALQNRPARAW